MPKLLGSASFRLTIGYLLLFSLSSLALLGFVYFSAASLIERQTQETIEAEITGLMEQYRTRGLIGLLSVIEARAAAATDRRSIYYLESPMGTRLAGNIDRWPVVGTAGEEGFRFRILSGVTGGEHTVLARRFVLPDRSRILIGRDIEERLAIQRTLRNVVLYGSGVMLLLALVGGLATSRLVLGRIDRINRTTSSIMAGADIDSSVITPRAAASTGNTSAAMPFAASGLAKRVELSGWGDEFDDLAANLNAMLERIERLVHGIREVSDNIAHDLRTPLNRMRGRLEASLRDADFSGQGRVLAEEMLADCDELIGTFNALLSIARAEAGSRDRWDWFALHDLIDDAIDLYEPLADEAGVRLDVVRGPEVQVFGDRQLVSQALANLIDNALKYGAAGGRVEIGHDALPSVWVADHGMGIPIDKRRTVFERFSRLDADRSTPGNGLGLSLVQAVVRLHEGRLELADNAPGLKVTFTLPSTLKQAAGASAG